MRNKTVIFIMEFDNGKNVCDEDFYDPEFGFVTTSDGYSTGIFYTPSEAYEAGAILRKKYEYDRFLSSMDTVNRDMLKLVEGFLKGFIQPETFIYETK